MSKFTLTISFFDREKHEPICAESLDFGAFDHAMGSAYLMNRHIAMACQEVSKSINIPMATMEKAVPVFAVSGPAGLMWEQAFPPLRERQPAGVD